MSKKNLEEKYGKDTAKAIGTVAGLTKKDYTGQGVSRGKRFKDNLIDFAQTAAASSTLMGSVGPRSLIVPGSIFISKVIGARRAIKQQAIKHKSIEQHDELMAQRSKEKEEMSRTVAEAIDHIINKNYDAANNLLEEQITTVLKSKLHEMKKIVAAHHFSESVVWPDGKVHTATGEKILPSIWRHRRGLTESSVERERFGKQAKETLGAEKSYGDMRDAEIKAATLGKEKIREYKDRKDDYGTLSDRITRIEQEPDWKSNKEKYKKWTKLVNKYNNRSYGIDKAVDRLTKEEAQLDEAKGDRLKANHEDALADMAGAIANARDAGENNKLGRLLKKRDFHRQALRNLKKKYPEKMDEETEQLDEVLKASDPAAQHAQAEKAESEIGDLRNNEWNKGIRDAQRPAVEYKEERTKILDGISKAVLEKHPNVLSDPQHMENAKKEFHASIMRDYSNHPIAQYYGHSKKFEGLHPAVQGDIERSIKGAAEHAERMKDPKYAELHNRAVETGKRNLEAMEASREAEKAAHRAFAKQQMDVKAKEHKPGPEGWSKKLGDEIKF